MTIVLFTTTSNAYQKGKTMAENDEKKEVPGQGTSKENNTGIVAEPKPPVNQSIQNQPSYFNMNTWRAMKEMANTFIQSGALPTNIKNAAQLVMIMQSGKELGMYPMESITNLYIVNGRVALQGTGMLSRILRAGIKLEWLEETEERASVKFTGLKRPEYTASFTMAEAKKAGLTGKDPWQKYPKNMLRWRALTNGARIFCPDVIGGLYMVEEISNNVEMKSDGEFAEVEKPPTPPAAAKPVASMPAPTTPVKPATPVKQADPTPEELSYERAVDAEVVPPKPAQPKQEGAPKPISPNQIAVIKKLAGEKNYKITDEEINALNVRTASAKITELIGMKVAA